MNSTKEKVRISVLTPSWNRADLLPRVWEGLKSQPNVSFEWLVGNDGSTDQTAKVVAEFAKNSHFPITLIEASTRIGKSCMDNLLVKAAGGDFIIWCDSDDVLNPDSLRQLLDFWEEVPVGEQDKYMGVSARAETDEGVLGKRFSAHMDGRVWNDIYSVLSSDLTIMARTELLKKNPFLEVDFLIPETSVWNVIGTKKARFIDRALVTKHYKQPFALSFTGKMQYSRGRAHALGQNYWYVRDQLGLRGEFLRSVNFIRYCAHGDVPFFTAKHIWRGGIISYCMLALGALPALLLVKRDQLRGVVEKTHIEFEVNRKKVQITCQSWGGRL